MTAIPAAGTYSGASITQGQMKTAMEQLLSCVKEVLGGAARSSKTLVSDAFTPDNDATVYYLDTESAAVLDNLGNITATNVRNGQFIGLRLTNSAHQVKVKNGLGGAGQIITADGADFLLENTSDFIILEYNSASLGTFTEVMRSSALRLKRLPGALEGVNLSVVSDTLTPTQFSHRVDPEGGTGPDNVQTINWLYPGLTWAMFCMKDSSEQVTWKHNTGGGGKIYLRDATDLVMSNTNQYLLLERRGSDAYEIGRFGFDTPAIILGGRLTASSTLPYPGDLTNQATGYLLPAGQGGNRLSLYKSGAWNVRTFTNPSLAFANAKYCPAYRFAYDNNGVVTLEDQRWDAGSQVSGSITGVSIAAAAVITSNAHGLNNGDIVAIDSITGTVGTDAKAGINSRANDVRQFTVSGVTANTFTIDAISTGLAYTSGGTWYKIPTAPALGTQDGIDIKSGDATRLLVGGYMTGFTAGQCDQTHTCVHVVSHLNALLNSGTSGVVNSTSHTYNSTTPRPFDNDHSKRVRWLSLVSRGQVRLSCHYDGISGASGVPDPRIGIDKTDGTGTYDGGDIGLGLVNAGFHLDLTAMAPAEAGSHFANFLEVCGSAASATFSGFQRLKVEVLR